MSPANQPGTIFFVHRGPIQPYVKAAILQCRAADPSCSLVVLGDQTQDSIPTEVISIAGYHLMGEYSELADHFEEIFRFEGKNSFEYELLNFQRWFYVRSFCETHSLTGPFLVLDSDAFLYVPMDQVTPYLTTSMTVVDRVGPQFTYFTNLQAIRDFTDFLTESFSTDSGFEALSDFVKESDDIGLPHVSDMAALGVYARGHSLDDLGLHGRHDLMFCENIGSPQGLTMNLLGKKVTSRKGRRYFTKESGQKILAGGVHLQGGNKDLWPYFVDRAVKQTMRQSSPVEYVNARRAARKKAFRIGLLKISAQMKNRPRPKSAQKH